MLRVSGTLAALLFISCSAQSTVAGANDPNQSSGEVVVRPSGQTVIVRAHQTLRVVRPADFSDWQVDYSSDVLKPLAPAQDMRTPGPDGWRFEAIARGETDVVVAPIVPPATTNAAPPRFSVTIQVP